MSKVLTSLPVGERVGIAFSGGLDTSVAVAWMREKGAVPCTYTADLGQYDEPDIPSVPGRALAYGAEISRAVDCRAPARRGGARGDRLRRLPPALRRPRATSTPRRSAGPSPARCWCARCTRTASTSGATGRRSRATTSSGSTATACWPTRRCASTSPGWTPTSSPSSAAATEMSQWLTERDLPYRDSKEKAYSTDANIWGATHEAKTLEHLDVSLETVEPIMGVKFWDPSVTIEPEDVTVRFEAGPPGRDQRQAVRRPGGAGPARPTPSAAATGWACPTRSRTASSRRSRAASTRRRASRCCSSPTSGCSTPSTTRTRSRTTTRRAAARAAALRGPVARPAGAHAPRVAAALGRLGRHRRGRRCGCGAARTTRSCAPRAPTSPTTRTSCRWSARRTPRSAPPTASAS